MTPLQLITFAAYILLATACLWACRAQPVLRPWALAMFLWAINVVAFYATYIVLGSRMSPTVIIFWRAFTGLQAAVVALGSLIITVVKMGRHE